MKAALVVVSYGSTALLEANLVALGRAAPEVNVVVVDNFSGQPEREAATALAEREGWNLVAPATNLGFGAGADVGVAAAVAAGCDVAVLLNPDARTSADTVRGLVSAVMADASALVGPLVVHPDGTPWFSDGVLDLRRGRTSTRGRLRHVPGSTTTARWLTGACLAFDLVTWGTHGGFDHRYFLYWEDVELSLRWQARGGLVRVEDHLVVEHEVGGTQGAPAAGKSWLYIRHNCRNRLLLGGSLGAGTYGRWLLLAPDYGWEVVRRGGRRRLLRQPSLLGAAVLGTLEGVIAGARALLRPGLAGR